MTYRFFLTIGSSQQQVYPLNFLKTSLQDTLDDDVIFYRRKFNGTLRFYNSAKDSITDFDLLYMVEQVDKCSEVILTIEQKDSGANTWHEYWVGYFTTTDGMFDHDNCYFDVTPKPYDDYVEFDKHGNDEYNIISAGLSLVTTNTYYRAYTRNYWLIDVIEYLATNIVSTATVISSFLESSINPVLGTSNQYNLLTIAQKSDIKRPTAENPATRGMMSFNQMMEILKMYNLFWTFDGTTIRIEHYDYWLSSSGLDLRTQRIAQRQNKYNYTRDGLPRFERFNFMEAEDSNYINHTISYNPICVNNDLEKILQLKVTTDIDYIRRCETETDDRQPSDIADDGWVILANYLDGANYHVYYGVSYYSERASHNYVNSWAHLLRSFFMHGRVLMSGKIQTVDVDFISARKTKSQSINAVVCYEDGYDPNNHITTELGEEYFGGQKGYVKQATIHPDGRVDFTLLYGEDKNINVDPPPRVKSLTCWIDAGFTTVTSVLSEANIYDTYYWIWFNDSADPSACMEIMIPAGTIIQDDMNLFGEASSAKFNISHTSLDGWQFIYGDNLFYQEALGGDCGSVPPVPDIPDPIEDVTLVVSQSGECEPIRIGWGTSLDATYYKLYRDIGSGFGLLYEGVNDEYYDYEAGIMDGTTIKYKVAACNIAGCSDDSEEKEIIPSCNV